VGRRQQSTQTRSPHGGAKPEDDGRAGRQTDRETRPGQEAAEETSHEKALDISYGPSKAQAIDVYYMPSGPPQPAAIFIHGGGWNSGSRKNVTRFLKAYETAGLACVAVGYRLSLETPHPAQIEDVMAAVRFVTENAETWNIDPARLATVGGSAGGQLAMWVAYQDDAPEIAAVVSVAGQTDLTQEFLDSLNPELKRNNMLLQLFGVAGSPEGLLSPGVQEEVRRFSPITHMTADDPPTAFIVWDEGLRPEKPDPRWGLHHAAFAERGKQRLDELGVEAKLVLLDQASADFGERLIAEEVEFLKKHLLEAGGADRVLPRGR
jgi:acetyl esterase/lipase